LYYCSTLIFTELFLFPIFDSALELGNSEFLKIDPLGKESEGARGGIVQLVGLCLALNEIAIESSIEDRGDVTGEFFMDEKRFRRVRLFTNKESYDGAWLSVRSQSIIRHISDTLKKGFAIKPISFPTPRFPGALKVLRAEAESILSRGMIKCTWEIGIEECLSQKFEGFFFCFLQARLFCDFSASSPEAVLAQGGVAIAGTGDESFSAVEGVC
jgi:hypothetical protein